MPENKTPYTKSTRYLFDPEAKLTETETPGRAASEAVEHTCLTAHGGVCYCDIKAMVRRGETKRLRGRRERHQVEGDDAS